MTDPTITDLVLADIADRHELGMRRYGKPLTPHDGRDMLREAYEEALDMVIYLRCALVERDGVGSAWEERSSTERERGVSRPA